MNQNILLIGLLIGALFFLRPQTQPTRGWAGEPLYGPGSASGDWRDLG